MSNSDSEGSEDWSNLSTVTNFDEGLKPQNKELVTVGEASRTASNSLFVESLVDQLCKLLVKDPAEQRQLYKALCTKLFELHLVGETYGVEELASLRSHYQQALVSLATSSPHNRYFQPEQLEGSRYHTEFEELSYIAAGGFGKVFKARNRLDGALYAVKKITLRDQTITTFRKRLSEVKTLAQLNYPNIVQYKSAWLEPLLRPSPSRKQPELSVLEDTSNGSDDIVFEASHMSIKEEVNESEMIVTSNRRSVEKRSECRQLAVCHQFQGARLYHPSFLQVGVVLFVSMQLCDGTLRQWLDTRNEFPEPVIDLPRMLLIFSQVALGLEYIHSCGIVHHDIKPSNIFLSDDLKSVQLGDFGLSCCLHGHSSNEPCPLEGGQTGTLMYAAPEQLLGHCTSKSDMFSLGLVLVELVTAFSTAMERSVVLKKLRAGYLPRTLPFDLVPLVRDLTDSEPARRPTASELVAKLQRLRAKSPSGAERRLVAVDGAGDPQDAKDREIQQLRSMLAERDTEIAELKRRLSES